MELQKPRGTRDFLFKEMKERKLVENTMREVFETYGYQEIKTPIFEDLSLFTLKSGEGIIEEIYHFQDKGGRDLALRPELTAPVARIYLNQLQKAPKPIKMYYFGSCFRYERPQAGRFRQFWQLGCELIGGKSPDSEAEIIAMAAHCLEELKLKDYQIHLGNLGILRGILSQDSISAEHQDQIMAMIDKGDAEELEKLLNGIEIPETSKNILLELIGMRGHQEIINNVKNILNDYPDALKSLEELESLLIMLKAFGFTDYIVNLGIARGLDYYTGTVFEIYVEGLGAQKQISGGGTYNLIEVFGGEKVESTGFAFGFDRVMEALKIQNPSIPGDERVDVFVAPISAEMKLNAFEIAQNLRKCGISTDVELVGRKLKKILSFAANSGAKFVVLIGARELEEGKVTIKDMTSGEQEQVSIEMVSDVLLNQINNEE
ncbi:histidine--tRNA ligase [Methanobacterium subterraneum]|jgi:histidyl-tRNA synthetase|uniref:Histidine--tRNA ligase n=1 Tax=Methanobacterium subterraneum TaxID=59277 RepID=A0A2H4VCT9_9EURY|nr:histidine--tRNA ligase [Methanobacterium subterraneum]AUB55891.1 histidine--tRNA ligase [Methanobacterium subterraneum]NMO08552.1 histidine--tRNA ligase [Methanobacterium subterraneum]PKL71478.1 MAG: histidine--tRNA ligase [Methanobacteriales archaeon HGW-Methanobacteriales-2]